VSTPLQEAVERLDHMDAQVKTEVIRGVSICRKGNGIPVLSIHYSADPERDPETVTGAQWYAAARAEYSSDKRWLREQEMDPRASGGERVFARALSQFHDKVIITDPNWRPDPRWDVVGGFDHGKVNATAFLKAYVDFQRNIYICGEFYSMQRKDWPENDVAHNAPLILQMPDIDRMRWCVADPSIFTDKELQKDGTYSSANKVYLQNGVKFLRQYEGERSDLTFVEKLLSEAWRDLEHREPTVRIVCRNESDRLQPGLHPYDCPNLVWELQRSKRAELTARQLLTRNPTEKIIDKLNHARDALKYLYFTVRRATAVPTAERMQEAIKGLNPTSAQIAAQRFYRDQVLGKQRRSVSFSRKGRMR